MSAGMQRMPEPELMDLRHEAEAYAAADFSVVNQAFVDRVMELARGRGRCRVVDLGCGPGDILRRLACRRPDWNIVGIDGSAVMLDLARRKLSNDLTVPSVEYLLGEATCCGLPSVSFDIVLSNSLLHHVRDPLALWREVQRLVKPGGLVLLRDLRRPACREDAAVIVEQHAGTESEMLREEFYRSLLAAYTVEEIREQLATVGVGYRVEEIGDRHVEITSNGACD